VHARKSHVCSGQDAKHHQARLVFNTVPGVRRGEVQILRSGIEAIRCVLLNGIHHASRSGKPEAGRNEGNDFSAA